MILYIVRHGQTEANVKHLFNGRNEKDLTEYGVKQAEELIPKLKDIDFEYIYCSPLTRAVHTANILNINNKPVIKDERIIERDGGKYTLQPLDLIKDRSILYDKEKKFEDFESFSSIIERVTNFVNDLKNMNIKGNVLVVTHGDIIKGFQECFNRRSDSYPETCSLIKFDVV